MIWFAIGFFCGASFGALMMAIVTISKEPLVVEPAIGPVLGGQRLDDQVHEPENHERGGDQYREANDVHIGPPVHFNLTTPPIS
jgi:hypothetical protein